MKKILALVLVALMVMSIAPTSFAATNVGFNYKDSNHESIGFSGIGTENPNEGAGAYPGGNRAGRITLGDDPAEGSSLDTSFSYDDLKVGRDEENIVKMYLWIRDANTGRYRPLVRQDVTQHKLAVNVRVADGKNTLAGGKPSIGYESVTDYHPDTTAGNGYGGIKDWAFVKVEWVNVLHKREGADKFDFTLYLTSSGTRITERNDTEVRFYGQISNRSQSVEGDYDYVEVYDRPQIDANTYVSRLEMADIVNGLTVYAKVFEGRKYYMYADQKPAAADDAILSKYPSIGTVYHLKQFGLESTGNTVKLQENDSTIYVYDGQLNLLGTSDKELPVRDTYYLSTEELDVEEPADNQEPVDGGDEPVDPTDPGDTSDNPTSGGDEVPENVNDNPGTGC
jgi:hypothetical protein